MPEVSEELQSSNRPVYLVSGDENIRPSDRNLRQAGRVVRTDNEVDEHARSELALAPCFVVVAHGREDGTILWFSSNRGTSVPWLWVGMPEPPTDTRLYLYSCRAGNVLPPSLTRCECAGHVTDVPMPTGGMQEEVLSFLDQVDNLVGNPDSNAVKWHSRLSAYVNRRLVEEAETQGPWVNSVALQMLRRSLGYADE